MKISLYMCGGERDRTFSTVPLGIGYLISNSDKQIDYVTDSDNLNNYEIIGLSSNAWGINEAIKIREKYRNKKIIIGGQVVLWNKIIDYGFDYIVYGEGETALNEILNNVSNPNLEYNQINNIDSIKFPYRGICKRELPIVTSRGCPYNCNFCSSANFWKKVRLHSAEYVIEELLMLSKKYPHIKDIIMLDDLFITRKDRLEKIHELLLKNKLNERFSFRCFIRSNMLTEDIAILLKNMNFKRIRFGAESGSSKILKLMNKLATVEDHQRAIDIANKVGIPISASFMHSYPNETEEDKQLTRDFVDRNKGKLSIEGNYKFKPFPGSFEYGGQDITKYDMRVR